jgi:hypothetical protein
MIAADPFERMPELRDRAGLALAALWEVQKHFQVLDNAADIHKAQDVLLAVLARQLADGREALRATQDELQSVEAKHAKSTRMAADQRKRAEHELDAMIVKAQATLASLVGRIADAKAALSAVDASFGSLRGRLDLQSKV